MPKCLGIYIEDDVIKYAKVDKNKDNLKLDNYNVVFYEKDKLSQTIDKIIRESYSTKDMISINISNELYNYFEVFSAFKQTDKIKSVDLDFELLCGEKGYNKNSLETRMLFRPGKSNTENERVIHIATNKENIRKTVQSFQGYKISTITPISTSIFNLLELGPKEENVIIVNIENETKITTVLGGEINNIDVIPTGMGEILNSINKTENSIKKAYECCKNTTIYTQDSEGLQLGEDNEYLEQIMPVLYEIAEYVKKISDSLENINKIYITGLATIINNIDLYFQENISSIKCELLKPFFLDKSASIQIPIKEYIEVNSAVALALEGLGYGEKSLNFKTKSVLEMDVNPQMIKEFFFGLIDPKKELQAFDKTMLRIVVCLIIGIVGYSVFSSSIMNQINEKSTEIKKSTEDVDSQIATINDEINKVESGINSYDQLVKALTAIDDSSEETGDNPYETTVIQKDAIPNLMNRIVWAIPTQVTVNSITNTEEDHIVIVAEADKYEQLGFFRALISTEGILLNVKSTSGTKSENLIQITIEGDLP